MRQFFLVSLLLAAVGCEGLRDRVRCRRDCTITEPCPGPEKKVSAPPPTTTEKVAAPASESARTAIAQEIMLVPTMVYRPFVAANPTVPVRLGANMTVAQPQDTSPVGVGKPDDTLKKALETCDKLQERINYLEKCLSERGAPTVVCPPTCPPQPLLRPLFRRPLFNRCESQCETPQCEPMNCTDSPASGSKNSGPGTSSPAPTSTSPLSISTPSGPERILQMPTRKATVERP